MKNNIYRMELGERVKCDEVLDAWRVPGGWIFATGHQGTTFGVFVPWNGEFMEVKN